MPRIVQNARNKIVMDIDSKLSFSQETKRFTQVPDRSDWERGAHGDLGTD